ncbi:CIR protein PIR protein [Plasmodium vinckei]|uniref:CIR protein PIR protein n=1 Tax=Plasmodium vinckei TaxID=5860 RepID=A0A6V7SK64_PLAVN|nr:CIR protein PIR protein [Plasmodium vinckei]
MAKSSYNINNVYKDINTINNYFYETKQNGLRIQKTNKIIHDYCHYGNNSGQGKCQNYIEMASSGAIHLLKSLKKYNLEDDKLAEYAILWLRYKLNQKAPYNNTQLNEFYTNYIVKNKDYNEKIKDNGPTYKEIIDKKKDLMNININEISKFSYPFNLLLFLYNATNANTLNCTNHSIQAKEFANRFNELNKNSNNIEGSSYNKLLSTISNDYDNLQKKCGNFPLLPEIEPKKRPAEISRKDSGQDSLESSERLSVQPTALIPEVTSSSSSISTTLIPALSIFSIIPVFLGISYKYSLFGIDKIFQRQYLRKKLKKVKKKMKLNI